MNASQKKHDRIMAEIEATRAKLTKLEENAYAGPYKAKWWVAKRKRTEYEKKLFFYSIWKLIRKPILLND